MAQEQSGAPMFRAEIAPKAGFLSWVIQQIAAPLPLVFWALLVSPLERVIAPWLQVSRNGFDLLLYLPVGWTLSFLLAILVQRKFPGAVVFGRRIWVLPLLLLALAFCSDAARFSFSDAFVEFFYPGPEGRRPVGVRTGDLSDRIGDRLLAGHDLVRAPSGIESVRYPKRRPWRCERSHGLVFAIGCD
jgi:hypothetical protein